MMIRRNYSGFTLIELLITVAIIAILATIAYPSYQQFLLESRRADAHSALSVLQLAQEQVRGSCRFYAGDFGVLSDCPDIDGDGNSDPCSFVCPDGATSSATVLLIKDDQSRDRYYSLSILAADGNSYTLVADPQNKQAKDSACDPIWLAVNTDNPNGLKGSESSGAAVNLTKADPDPNLCWN